MLLETVESEGLAHLSYLLGDEEAGACVVIDPRRDVSIYLELARKNHCRITQILETHIHADFISGSRELEAQTGAPIAVGRAPGYGFPHRPLADGDRISVGRLRLDVLQTPGHTPEHVCFLVSGGKGSEEPWGLFSGDTLFAGEVGRPDLLGDGSEEGLARQLYHSLRDRLLKLGDEVEVYPAHGQGSPCGGSIGDRNTTTVGYERANNPKLQSGTEDSFVEQVLTDLPPAPRYYARMKRLNEAGPRVLGCIPHIPALSPQEFCDAVEHPNVVVVDTREIEAAGGAHIEGSLNIALRDEFPIWSGWMLRPDQTILLVLHDESKLDQTQRHLLRIGIEKIGGFLRGGMRSWMEAGLPFRRTLQLSVHELRARIESEDDLQILDVRSDGEWASGRIPGAQHIFAADLPDQQSGLDPKKPVAVYCGSGYRAAIAASVLERSDFRQVMNIPGSVRAWKAAGFKLVGSC